MTARETLNAYLREENNTGVDLRSSIELSNPEQERQQTEEQLVSGQKVWPLVVSLSVSKQPLEQFKALITHAPSKETRDAIANLIPSEVLRPLEKLDARIDELRLNPIKQETLKEVDTLRNQLNLIPDEQGLIQGIKDRYRFKLEEIETSFHQLEVSRQKIEEVKIEKRYASLLGEHDVLNDAMDRLQSTADQSALVQLRERVLAAQKRANDTFEDFRKNQYFPMTVDTVKEAPTEKNPNPKEKTKFTSYYTPYIGPIESTHQPVWERYSHLMWRINTALKESLKNQNSTTEDLGPKQSVWSQSTTATASIQSSKSTNSAQSSLEERITSAQKKRQAGIWNLNTMPIPVEPQAASEDVSPVSRQSTARQSTTSTIDDARSSISSITSNEASEAAKSQVSLASEQRIFSPDSPTVIQVGSRNNSSLSLAQNSPAVSAGQRSKLSTVQSADDVETKIPKTKAGNTLREKMRDFLKSKRGGVGAKI